MLFLIKIGEISLKGGNRSYFEKRLSQNIKRRLKEFQPTITVQRGRFLLEIADTHSQHAEAVLATTFGVVAFSRAISVDKNRESIRTATIGLVEEFLAKHGAGTFKIAARRSDKSYPMSSYEIASDLGSKVCERFPAMKVDVHSPDLLLSVEVRNKAFCYGNDEKGPGGLPVGVAGKGILLLSGGIDSPVACYLMAKRGLALDAVYFHTYPYTPDDALEKVKTLARILSTRCGGINLFAVPFTDVALHIRKSAPMAETTLLMRACMMAVASRIAKSRYALCLVTGESLGQVASQTAQSMRFTQSTSPLPVFRPLIGYDKEEIISIARDIGTYETSVLPYEDCCTVFSPKKPLIRPDQTRMTESYENMEIDEYLSQACALAEKSWFPPGVSL